MILTKGGGFAIKKRLKDLVDKQKDYRRLMIVFLITGTYLYLGAVNDIFISTHDDGLVLLFSSLIISLMAGLFGLESFLLKKKIERMSMK